jgi:uncharacterized phage protein gp47/JayE
MSDSLTSTPPTVTVDAAGIHVPTFASVLAWWRGMYQAIYGADVDLDADTQDGQWIGLLATAHSDCNAMVATVYQQFAPSTAIGTGLDSVVKVNGLRRKAYGYSTADIAIVGDIGTTLISCAVKDAAGNIWNLPAVVVIPASGTITVTATCATPGAISAAAGAISTINTPTRGWASATNPAAAAVGAPVETDAQLRQRQSTSAAMPAQATTDAIVAAVANLANVSSVLFDDNDSDITDANGVPAHSLALVVTGGDAQAIANTIGAKKPPGTPTYGSTSKTYVDAYGIPKTINFSRPLDVPIFVSVTVTPLENYSSAINAEINAAIVAWINGLPGGQGVLLNRLYVPANLAGAADSLTYEITSLKIGTAAGSLGSSDIPIAWNQQATCATADVTVTP